MVKYREFVASSGLRVFGGRDAESNDELVNSAGAKDVLLHTVEPGSPFVNVGEAPSKSDLKEAAVFCARYSQDWRDRKSDVAVNKFLRCDMNKSPKMKVGSWSAKKQERMKVKRGEILVLEEREIIDNR